mgnify:CR=1 FL=1
MDINFSMTGRKERCFWLLLGIPNCGIRFLGNHFSDNHVEYYEQYFNECFCKGEAIRCDACCWDGEQAGYKDDNWQKAVTYAVYGTIAGTALG